MMATAAAASPWSVPLRYSELNNATVYTQTQPDTAEAELVLGTIRTCAEGNISGRIHLRVKRIKIKSGIDPGLRCVSELVIVS